MSGFDFPGGIGQIDIDDTGSFDTGASTDPSTFVVTFGKKAIHQEMTEFPDPEALTGELGDDREGRLGLDQNMTIGAAYMDFTDFETLEDEALKHTDLFVRVQSFATKSGGGPLYEVVYSPVVLSNAVPSPVNTDRSSYGGYMFDGKATGYRYADLASITQN